MHDEHQTSPVEAEGLPVANSPAAASQDRLSALAQLDIQLRAAKPVPLQDPFQFTVYLAKLASSGSPQ